MRRTIVLALALAALAAFPASAKTLTNKDGGDLALQGYDPVAFFTDGRPVLGSASISETYDGATYRFSSAEHRAAFEKEPSRYAPAFGGFCALGAAYGHLVPVKIETWQILDGRLVLNKDLDVKAEFDKDRSGNLKKADANWPGLVEKNGM